uniref:40S ribosomal protein S12 n=1 Tax=Panagrolaimus sp. JU765 TaxID=591449 RepID=A0AC34RLZ8_9BILA
MASVGDAPSIDVQLALKRVLRSASVVDGVSRGLHQAVKDLDKRTAYFCVFCTACDEPAYEKLVRALKTKLVEALNCPANSSRGTNFGCF